MVSFSLLLVFGVPLHFSKIGAFIVRSEVDHDLLIIAGKFLLVLLDAALDDDIHVIVSFPFRVNLGACLKFLKGGVLEDLPSLFCITNGVPLLRMMKNLLKLSIFSRRSMFLLPGGNLYSSLMALMFSRDCISMLFRMSLTEGISMGGLSFNFLS